MIIDVWKDDCSFPATDPCVEIDRVEIDRRVEMDRRCSYSSPGSVVRSDGLSGGLSTGFRSTGSRQTLGFITLFDARGTEFSTI